MEIVSNNAKPRGRPRQFDRESALDTAMRLFWQRGFEATSINDLAGAIGINVPSLYAAFGDKKRLFRESVDRYRAHFGGFAVPAMASKVTAKDAIDSLLQASAHAYTNETCPRGCMVIHAAVNCGAEADDIAAELAAIRDELDELIIARIALGKLQGDVPSHVDARALGLFYTTMLKGMSARARDGTLSETLETLAHQAMAAWPDG